MSYTSTITFTLDTICPWTHLALTRLLKALRTHRALHPSHPVPFTLLLAPYQLHPSLPSHGIEKHTWYRDEKLNGDDSRFQKFNTYMAGLGAAEGITMDFSTGEMGNSFPALRVLMYVQEMRGSEAAVAALESLYRAYFAEGLRPGDVGALREACRVAGLGSEESEKVVGDEDVYAAETRRAVQEQAGNGVDSVPYVVFEGRKRDFTLIGAKEVGEYVKTLEQVVKEAV